MTDSRTKWKIYVWLMTGLILSSALAFLWHGNGRINQRNFWSNGAFYDFGSEELRAGTESCPYVGDGFLVNGDNGKLWFEINSDVERWQEMAFELKNISSGAMNWRISFLNEQMEGIYTTDVIANEGWNYVYLGIESKVFALQIEILGQPGVEFSINAAKLCQKSAIFDSKRFLWKIVWIFYKYLFLSAILYVFKSYGWYLWIEITQKIYIAMGDRAGAYFHRRFSGRTRKRLRAGLFGIIFLLLVPLNLSYGIRDTITARYYILGIMAGIVLAVLLAWEKPLKKINWKNPMAGCWFALCALLIFSDILIKKDIPYAGFFLWAVFGFMFFVWQNTGKYDSLLRDVTQGLIYTLPVIAFYCLVFREKKPGVLYNGCFSNSESMALYMMGVWIAFLIKMNGEIQKKFCSRLRILLYEAGFFLSLYYLYCTRSTLCLSVVLVVSMIWLWRQIKNWKRVRRCVAWMLVSFVVSVGIVGSVYYGGQFLPSKLGTDIVYENETYGSVQRREDSEILRWLEYEKMQGRDKDLIWKNYIRNLNLTGHDAPLIIFRKWAGASNLILDMMYYYGVFVLIPYLPLLAGGIWYAWKKKDFLNLAVVISFEALSMVTNLGQMFLQPLWFLFYFGLGKMLSETD